MEQINMFELLKPRFYINKPIRLIELFAGIGSQAKALHNINANFEHYKVIEFNTYAIESYNAIHDTYFEISDIKELKASDLEIKETDKYCYLMTYSFPCQDLSKAGLGKGMAKGSDTRSGLLWEVERLLDECDELPQVLIMENVPEVINEKNIKDFNLFTSFLTSKGYQNYIEILNSKDYGIPQNRKRCFMVSILGNYYYSFPQKIKLEKKLLDFLEKEEVDMKYFISQKLLNYFIDIKNRNNYIRNQKFKPHNINKSNYSYTITTRQGSVATDNYILVPEKTLKGYSVANIGDGIYLDNPHQKNGTVQKNMIPTIRSNFHSLGVIINKKYGRIMDNGEVNFIRRITPKESFRLMGFSDDDFYKCRLVNSESQLYKQAGNSIVVKVLEEIFKQLIIFE